MKNILIIILFIGSFTITCKKTSEKISLNTSKSDTVFLKEQETVFISPSDKSIKKLKEKYGDDFYTIADDANNYFSEATSYLDSLKISYKNYDDSKIIGFRTNNAFVKIPNYKSPWYLIFYKDGKFKTLDVINIREELPKFFGNSKSDNNLDTQKIISSIAGNKYFVVEEKSHDLNNDSFMDKIIVLGNKEDINPQDPDSKIAPIIILLNDHNKNFKILKNENIYPNNYGDAFKKLVTKNNFFTIELSNEVPNESSTYKYITFKYDEKSKEIVLSKYGENIDWNDGKKNNTLCSDKNFGRILFQDFNSNDIREKCSH